MAKSTLTPDVTMELAAGLPMTSMQPSSFKLLETSGAMRLLLDKIADQEGVLDSSDEAALNALEPDVKARSVQVGFYAKELKLAADIGDALATAYEQRAKELRMLNQPRRSRAERFLEYVHQAMKSSHTRKIEAPGLRLTVCDNSAPSVDFAEKMTRQDEEAFLRELAKKKPEFVRFPSPELARSVVAKAVKDGEPLPDGIRVEIGTHLRMT